MQGLAVGEDVRLQRAQLRPWIHAELLGEQGTGAPDGVQRLRLPPRAVVGQRQQPHRVLPERVGADVAFQRRYGLGGAAERQDGLGPVLGGDQPQLLQLGRLGQRPFLVGELPVRAARPQLRRLVEALQGVGGLSRTEAGGGRLHQPGEAPGVDLVGVQAEQVAGRGAHQHPRRGPRRAAGLQDAAQVGDVRLQPRQRLGRRLPPPQVVEEPVGGHHVPAGAHQPDHDGTLQRRAQIHRMSGHLGPHLAQHP